MLADFAVTLRSNLGTYFKNSKDMSKIALGTWAWGAGAFGGDPVWVAASRNKYQGKIWRIG
jgi:hypothetical protein